MSGNLRAFLAEAIGTFALVIAGAGAVCIEAVTGLPIGPVGVALAQGLAVMAMWSAYGPVSGGHFNPALTVALLLHKRLDTVKAVFYVVSQLLGAALAGLLLSAVLRSHPNFAADPTFLGACALKGVGFKAGTLIEAVGAFFWVSVFYSRVVEERDGGAAAPLALGAAVGLATLLTFPLTGAALSPARAFGPSLATGQWHNWYVYWIGPAAGAVAAAFLHERLFLGGKRP